MAKQPYIPFYIGDYIQDTRVLPLFAKGGWVDLILAMWKNDPQGELVGNIEDFSRIMNCDTKEGDLVIQILKQKNIFSYEKVDANGTIKIISRKQKKMSAISKTRKETGGKGGNPKLVNQTTNQKNNISLSKINKSDNLIPEYENNNDNENNKTNNGVGKFLVSDMMIVWLKEFPRYSKNEEKDTQACKNIAEFIFNSEGIINGFGNKDHEKKAIESFSIVAKEVAKDNFWKNKSLVSISNHIQEFYNKIKNPTVNGTTKRNIGQAPVAEIIDERGFGDI